MRGACPDRGSHGPPSRGRPTANAEVLLPFVWAALAGRDGGADFVERGPVDPFVTFAGVVAVARIELLQEADHPGGAEFAAEGL